MTSGFYSPQVIQRGLVPMDDLKVEILVFPPRDWPLKRRVTDYRYGHRLPGSEHFRLFLGRAAEVPLRAVACSRRCSGRTGPGSRSCLVAAPQGWTRERTTAVSSRLRFLRVRRMSGKRVLRLASARAACGGSPFGERSPPDRLGPVRARRPRRGPPAVRLSGCQPSGRHEASRRADGLVGFGTRRE